MCELLGVRDITSGYGNTHFGCNIAELRRDVDYLVHALHVQIVGFAELLALLLAVELKILAVDALIADEVAIGAGDASVSASGKVFLSGRKHEGRSGRKECKADCNRSDHGRIMPERFDYGP